MFRKLTYDFPKKILGNLNLLTSENLGNIYDKLGKNLRIS